MDLTHEPTAFAGAKPAHCPLPSLSSVDALSHLHYLRSTFHLTHTPTPPTPPTQSNPTLKTHQPFYTCCFPPSRRATSTAQTSTHIHCPVPVLRHHCGQQLPRYHSDQPFASIITSSHAHCSQQSPSRLGISLYCKCDRQISRGKTQLQLAQCTELTGRLLPNRMVAFLSCWIPSG